jgi:hypothetical protein
MCRYVASITPNHEGRAAEFAQVQRGDAPEKQNGV